MSLQINALPFCLVIIFGVGFLYFANQFLFQKYTGPESRKCALFSAIIFGVVTVFFASRAFVIGALYPRNAAFLS
jgi:hypothetical protein